MSKALTVAGASEGVTAVQALSRGRKSLTVVIRSRYLSPSAPDLSCGSQRK